MDKNQAGNAPENEPPRPASLSDIDGCLNGASWWSHPEKQLKNFALAAKKAMNEADRYKRSLAILQGEYSKLPESQWFKEMYGLEAVDDDKPVDVDAFNEVLTMTIREYILLNYNVKLVADHNPNETLRIYAKEVLELREAIRWIAQTVHQGNHTDMKGTFMECPKSTCTHAKEMLARGEAKEVDKDERA